MTRGCSRWAWFGNKDRLVRAYLTAHDEGIRERVARELAAKHNTPRERLLGLFEVQGLRFTETGFPWVCIRSR
jgi:hypothetical protein